MKITGIMEVLVLGDKKPEALSQICYKLCVTLDKFISSLWGCGQWETYGDSMSFHSVTGAFIHSFTDFIQSHICSLRLMEPVFCVRRLGIQNEFKSKNLK